MDLKEIECLHKKDRHPWELSRIKALRMILVDILAMDLKVLDLGCGDGYVSRELFNGAGKKDVTAVDTHFSKEQIDELSKFGDNVTYLNKIPMKGGRYDFIILLDLIEHIEDDTGFLRKVVDDHLVEDGRILITVPAFQSLFSSHDKFLAHYRRYNIKELERLVGTAGLKCSHSGYLFTLLMATRFLSLCTYTAVKETSLTGEGIGRWNHGKVVSNVIEAILTADNNFSLAVNRFNIKIPGLTAWALCKKQ